MRRQRTRSPHPGVVLIAPEQGGRRLTWRARYTDPDTSRPVKERLDPVVLPTAERRRHWAIAKSKALAKRRLELEAGAPRATGGALDEAVEHYFKAHPQLRPKTLVVYRAAADKLLAWATKVGVAKADDLNRARLMGFRQELVSAPRHAAAAGGKRGARVETTQPRSPYTVNRELRATRTILGYLCDLDLFARLTSEDLRRALKRLETSLERVDYRKPSELQSLLEAAIRHDAATFAVTREEHRRALPPGSTLRHDPIAPFVAATLLTGMRFGEVVSLDWKQVDLDALDNEGRTVGEIHLTGATKTKRARTVGLEVSPALRKMLAIMHLKSGGKGSVFGLTRGAAESAAHRLVAEYGAPQGSGWQALRRTCGTYLTNAPGIFGAASAYRSAKQLGHSVQVAEKHYVGVTRGIPREARTLEAAMQIEAQMKLIIRGVSAGRPALSPAVGSSSGQVTR